MLADLKRLLQQQPHADQPMTTSLEHLWKSVARSGAYDSIRKADIPSKWLSIVSSCWTVSKALGLPGLRWQCRLGSREARVVMGQVLYVGKEAHIALELTTDFEYASYLDDLDKLVGMPWLGWNGVEDAEGAQALLLKVAVWMGAKNVRWGIIGTERQFRIIRLDYATIPGNNRPYPYLMMSDSIPIDSGTHALVSLLFYMGLSGVEARPDLFPIPDGLEIPAYDPYEDLSPALPRTCLPEPKGTSSSQPALGRTPDEGCDLRTVQKVTRPDSHDGSGRWDGMNADGARQLKLLFRFKPGHESVESVVRVQPEAHDFLLWDVHFDDEPFSPIPSPVSSPTMSRRTSDASDASEADAAIPTIVVHSHSDSDDGLFFHGTIGPTKVVITIDANHEPAHEQEAFLYEHYLSTATAGGQSPIAPDFYGYFSTGVRRYLLLSDTGKVLESFDQLSLDGKTRLLDQVHRLHAMGIVHSNLRPWNVRVADDGTTTIVNFSCGFLHDCDEKKKQMGYCQELRSFTRWLGLDEASSLSLTPLSLTEKTEAKTGGG
ncbi:MAG: hypothetical protein M1826_002928, partial [Phylliscum demangeonii]